MFHYFIVYLSSDWPVSDRKLLLLLYLYLYYSTVLYAVYNPFLLKFLLTWRGLDGCTTSIHYTRFMCTESHSHLEVFAFPAAKGALRNVRRSPSVSICLFVCRLGRVAAATKGVTDVSSAWKTSLPPLRGIYGCGGLYKCMAPTNAPRNLLIYVAIKRYNYTIYFDLFAPRNLIYVAIKRYNYTIYFDNYTIYFDLLAVQRRNNVFTVSRCLSCRRVRCQFKKIK